MITIPFFFTGLLAYPCQDVSEGPYEYFTLFIGSTLSSARSDLLLVGCELNTSISITPSQSVELPQDPQSPTSSMISIPAGSSHNIILNQMQTLLVRSDDDLTGTRIVSNNPLTVISGHSRTLPFNEHIPPTSTWGKSYLLIPFGERSRVDGQYYKIVASEHGTSFTRFCNNTQNTSFLPIAGNFEEFFTNSTTYCSLVSDKPVLVSQLVADVIRFGRGFNSIMSIVPSVDQYTDRYSFTPLNDTDYDVIQISVSVLPQFYVPSSIRLNGRPITATWNKIYNDKGTIVGYACHVNISGGSVHTVHHDNSSGKLSVIVFGSSNTTYRQRRYSYLAGLRFLTSQIGMCDLVSSHKSYSIHIY